MGCSGSYSASAGAETIALDKCQHNIVLNCTESVENVPLKCCYTVKKRFCTNKAPEYLVITVPQNSRLLAAIFTKGDCSFIYGLPQCILGYGVPGNAGKRVNFIKQRYKVQAIM